MHEHWCCFCRQKIIDGLRWVRMKVPGSGQNNTAPTYRYYHADVLGGETQSCHEKWQMEEYAHVP